MVFAGVGIVALPLDMIREFWGRPKSTIPKSEYVKRARGLGVRANGVKVLRPAQAEPCLLPISLPVTACLQSCMCEAAASAHPRPISNAVVLRRS